MQKYHCSIYIYLIFCVCLINAFLRKVNHTKYIKRQNLRNDVKNETVPSYWDWRKHKVLSDIKKQTDCDNSWAMAVVDAVESQAAIWLNLNVKLSFQMLVDCDNSNRACRGGYPLKAYETLLKYGSVYAEDYKENRDQKQAECRYSKEMKKIPVLGYSKVPPDEEVMKEYVYKYGPLVAAINSEYMHNYQGSGIDVPKKHTCPHAPNNLDHAVLIVGYGEQIDRNYKKKLDYWIIKNSWGRQYGDQGYYRIKRKVNACGIANDVSIPIVPLYS